MITINEIDEKRQDLEKEIVSTVDKNKKKRLYRDLRKWIDLKHTVRLGLSKEYYLVERVALKQRIDKIEEDCMKVDLLTANKIRIKRGLGHLRTQLNTIEMILND